MTPPSDTDVRELIERLRGPVDPDADPRRYPRNPDGHEAATALESLLQDRARMEERVREIAKLKLSPAKRDDAYLVDYWRAAFDRVRDMARVALSRSG